MNEKFEKLEEEKRLRIMNSAMQVFASQEYRKASTDDIVQLAGISKGLLFHYFGNKKNLYLYLFRFAFQFIYDSLKEYDSSQQPDFFLKMSEMQKLKLAVIQDYPYLYGFVMKAYAEKEESIQKELAPYLSNNTATKALTALLEGVDLSRFQDDVDIAMLLRIFTWIANGYVQDVLNLSNMNAAEACADFDRYITLLRNHFYKEEYR